MQNLWFKVLRDEKTEGSDGGGGTPPVPKEKPAAAKDDSSSEGDGDQVDDLGYAKSPEGDKTPEAKKPADKKVEEDDGKSLAGYDETKVEPPKEDFPAPKAPIKVEPDEYDKAEAFKGLPDVEVEALKEFSKKNKLSPEVAKEYGDLRRKELADALEYQKNAEKEAKAAVEKQKSAWVKELKDDGKFGGEKFPETIKKTNKILQEFFPRWKKTLTDRNGMLPPDVMRDLAELADHLYSKERVVNGQPPTPPDEKENDSEEHLKFYS